MKESLFLNLIAQLKDHDENFSVLDLSNQSLSDEQIAALTSALAENKTLTHLNLSGNKISANNIFALTKALTKHPSLIELNLNHTALGDTHTVALAEYLLKNQTLRRLQLNNNQITAVGTKQLADALQSDTQISQLTLRDNPLNSEGIVFLIEGLCNNRSLTSIDLRDTGPAPKEIPPLFFSLNHSLVEIKLPSPMPTELNEPIVRRAWAASSAALTLFLLRNKKTALALSLVRKLLEGQLKKEDAELADVDTLNSMHYFLHEALKWSFNNPEKLHQDYKHFFYTSIPLEDSGLHHLWLTRFSLQELMQAALFWLNLLNNFPPGFATEQPNTQAWVIQEWQAKKPMDVDSLSPYLPYSLAELKGLTCRFNLNFLISQLRNAELPFFSKTSWQLLEANPFLAKYALSIPPLLHLLAHRSLQADELVLLENSNFRLLIKSGFSLEELLRLQPAQLSSLNDPRIRRDLLSDKLTVQQLNSLKIADYLKHRFHPLLPDSFAKPVKPNIDIKKIQEKIYEGEAPLYYLPVVDGSISDFCSGSKCTELIAQYLDLIQQLKDWVVENKVKPGNHPYSADDILTIFCEHLNSTYFSDHRSLIYSETKYMLECIVLGLIENHIPMATKRMGIADLLNDLDKCSGGVHTVVEETYLLFYTNEANLFLANARYKIAIQTAINFLRPFMLRNGVGNEKHFAHAYLMLMEDLLGILVPNDPLTQQGIDVDLLPKLLKLVRKDLTPSALLDALTQRLLPEIEQGKPEDTSSLLAKFGRDHLELNAYISDASQREHLLKHTLLRRLLLSQHFDLSALQQILGEGYQIDLLTIDNDLTTITFYDEDDNFQSIYFSNHLLEDHQAFKRLSREHRHLIYGQDLLNTLPTENLAVLLNVSHTVSFFDLINNFRQLVRSQQKFDTWVDSIQLLLKQQDAYSIEFLIALFDLVWESDHLQLDTSMLEASQREHLLKHTLLRRLFLSRHFDLSVLQQILGDGYQIDLLTIDNNDLTTITFYDEDDNFQSIYFSNHLLDDHQAFKRLSREHLRLIYGQDLLNTLPTKNLAVLLNVSRTQSFYSLINEFKQLVRSPQEFGTWVNSFQMLFKHQYRYSVESLIALFDLVWEKDDIKFTEEKNEGKILAHLILRRLLQSSKAPEKTIYKTADYQLDYLAQIPKLSQFIFYDKLQNATRIYFPEELINDEAALRKISKEHLDLIFTTNLGIKNLNLSHLAIFLEQQINPILVESATGFNNIMGRLLKLGLLGVTTQYFPSLMTILTHTSPGRGYLVNLLSGKYTVPQSFWLLFAECPHEGFFLCFLKAVLSLECTKPLILNDFAENDHVCVLVVQYMDYSGLVYVLTHPDIKFAISIKQLRQVLKENQKINSDEYLQLIDLIKSTPRFFSSTTADKFDNAAEDKFEVVIKEVTH